MKKILILAIALLFVAGLAMADVTVKAEVQYNTEYYSGDAGNQFTSGGYAKLMFSGSNDFASVTVDIKGNNVNGTALGLDGNAFIKLDVLGSMGIEGVPVTVNAIFGLEEFKGDEVWKVTRSEVEGNQVDTGAGKNGMIGAEIVIMEMVTVKLGHQTANGAASYYTTHDIAPTMIGAKLAIEFVEISASVEISKAVANTQMFLNVSGGAKVGLADLLGIDLISALDIGLGAGMSNENNVFGVAPAIDEYDITYGAGVNLELAPIDLLTVRFGISTFAEMDGTSGVTSSPFQNLGIDIEVMYDWIGIGANTSLAFGNKAGNTNVDILSQSEVSLIAKLSSVTLNLGFMMDPAVTNTEPDLEVKKYAENACGNGNMGMFFKAKLKI